MSGLNCRICLAWLRCLADSKTFAYMVAWPDLRSFNKSLTKTPSNGKQFVSHGKCTLTEFLLQYDHLSMLKGEFDSGHLVVCQICCIPECEKGRWGLACAELCPDCENGGECDKQNGTCVCPPGYTGNLCQAGRSGHSCNLSDSAGPHFQDVYTLALLLFFITSTAVCLHINKYILWHCFSLRPCQSAQMAGLVLAASFSALVRTATTVIPSQASVCVKTAGLEPTVRRVKSLWCFLQMLF